jgi:predicted nucleic acid-binding protein
VYLLDTNIISFSVYHPTLHPLLEKNIRATRPSDRWISVITAHELIAFKYENIGRTKSMASGPLLKFYEQFDDILSLIRKLQIKPFDSDAYRQFLGMPGAVGVHDRRIAATALAYDLTLVTHDGDFRAIKAVRPKLRVEDWVEKDYTGRR